MVFIRLYFCIVQIKPLITTWHHIETMNYQFHHFILLNCNMYVRNWLTRAVDRNISNTIISGITVRNLRRVTYVTDSVTMSAVCRQLCRSVSWWRRMYGRVNVSLDTSTVHLQPRYWALYHLRALPLPSAPVVHPHSRAQVSRVSFSHYLSLFLQALHRFYLRTLEIVVDYNS